MIHKLTSNSTARTRLERHFLTCSATAAAATALIPAEHANAAVVYSGIVNLPVFATEGGAYFDVESPFGTSQGPTRVTGWEMNPYTGGTKLYSAAGTHVVLSGAAAANLVAGTTIGAGSLFSGGNFAGDVAIPGGQTGFIGYNFDPQGVTGVQNWNGWFRMTVSAAGTGTVTDWAYENTGASIAAGAIPEPSSLALLAMGAAGVAGWRRRRAA